MADDYKHEVFISYSRKELWPQWVEETFMPLFRHYLINEIPDARIFVDYDMETGCTYPAKLAEGLSGSKVLVGLWCGPYFSSAWCLTELSLMVAREDKHGFGTQQNPQRLIVPASIHDGDAFPDEAKKIQWKHLQECSRINMAKGSKKMEELEEKISGWVHDIKKAIDAAPDYDDSFESIAYEHFMDTFRSANTEQTILPSMGN